MLIHGKNERGHYLGHNAVMISEDSRSMYLVNDSNEHIHLNTSTLVAQGEDSRGVKSIVDTIGTTGGEKNLEKLDCIITMTNKDSPPVLKMSADSEFSCALLARSKVMDAHDFREELMKHLSYHMKYVLLGVDRDLTNDQVLKEYYFLATKEKVYSKGETDLGSFTVVN